MSSDNKPPSDTNGPSDDLNEGTVEPEELTLEQFALLIDEIRPTSSNDDLEEAKDEQRELFIAKYGFDPNDEPENARLKLELHRLAETLKNDKDIRKMRRKFSRRIFGISSLWLGGVFIILLFQGFGFGFDWSRCGIKSQPFYLTDTVLTALLAATGAIGLLAIVLRNLFPGSEKKESDKV